jgi:hypothetical protein
MHTILKYLMVFTTWVYDLLDKAQTEYDKRAPTKDQVKEKWGQARDTTGGWIEGVGQWMQSDKEEKE